MRTIGRNIAASATRLVALDLGPPVLKLLVNLALPGRPPPQSNLQALVQRCGVLKLIPNQLEKPAQGMPHWLSPWIQWQETSTE
jgi:hypothetical protein